MIASTNSSREERWEQLYQALLAYEAAPLAEYGELSNILMELREAAVDRLKRAVGRLSALEIQHHPIFQSISLLEVLNGSGLRETAHTRIISWLLDPKKPHGFGSKILFSLLEYLAIEGRLPFAAELITDEAICVTKVAAEHPLSDKSGRRIDIWLEGEVKESPDGIAKKWLVIIEAKVDSAESNKQLQYYEREARKWEGSDCCRPVFVFLTRKGNHAATGKKEEWLPMGFESVARVIWWAIKDKQSKAGFHLAQYYISGVLADVCEWPIPFPNVLSEHELFASGITNREINPFSLLGLFEKIDLKKDRE